MKPIFISWWHIIAICLITSCTVTVPERLGSDMTISNGKKDGWSASGELQLGSSSKEISLQASFDDPGPYTIQFNVDYPNETNPLSPDYYEGYPSARAQIFWSVEGNSIERNINLTPGVSISGVGQGVKVKVTDVSSFTVSPANTLTYPVGVQVVKGLRTSIEPPFLFRAVDRTRLVAPVAPGIVISGEVPLTGGVNGFRVFAGFSNGPGIEDGVIEMGVNVKKASVLPFQYAVILDPQKQGLIPLPPGAFSYYVRLRSVPVGSGDFYWNILWSIDG